MDVGRTAAPPSRPRARWLALAGTTSLLLLLIAVVPGSRTEASPTEGCAGTFEAPETYPAGPNAHVVASADMNGDGEPDLVAAAGPRERGEHYDPRVSVLLGGGDGTFGEPIATATGSSSTPKGFALADLDVDGAVDLVTANADIAPAGTVPGTISVLLGKGDASFEEPVLYHVGDGPRDVDTADLDADGVLDLAVDNIRSDEVSTVLGRGDGTFFPATEYRTDYPFIQPVGDVPRSLTAADLDGDGVVDLATANGHSDDVTFLRGEGDGSVGPPIPSLAGEDPDQIAHGDFDGDGVLDLATTHFASDVVSTMRGTGLGAFEPPVQYRTVGAPRSIEAVDLHGDGLLDLVMADSASEAVVVLPGEGGGTFGELVGHPTGQRPLDATVADLDGNGVPDLAAALPGRDEVAVLLDGCP